MGVAREDHHARARRRLAHAPRHFQAVEARHRDIGDEHVGLQLPYERHDLEAVRGFADDSQVRLALEETAERLPDDLLVVGQQYACHPAFHNAARAGPIAPKGAKALTCQS